jgi:hypothetical protein
MDEEAPASTIELDTDDDDVLMIDRHLAWLARPEASEMAAGASQSLPDDLEPDFEPYPHPAATQARYATLSGPPAGRHQAIQAFAPETTLFDPLS